MQRYIGWHVPLTHKRQPVGGAPRREWPGTRRKVDYTHPPAITSSSNRRTGTLSWRCCNRGADLDLGIWPGINTYSPHVMIIINGTALKVQEKVASQETHFVAASCTVTPHSPPRFGTGRFIANTRTCKLHLRIIRTIQLLSCML